MTHHTDAELLPCPFCGDNAETDYIPEHHSYAIECYSIGCAARVIKETAEDAIAAWNRRAPAVPVLDGLREAAQAVVDRWDTPLWKDVPATAVYIADLRAALAAAPQPPEVAPVQLPEPIARIEGGSLKWHIPDSRYSLPVRYLQGTHNLYTEHQVRQLLADHGIK